MKPMAEKPKGNKLGTKLSGIYIYIYIYIYMDIGKEKAVLPNGGKAADP